MSFLRGEAVRLKKLWRPFTVKKYFEENQEKRINIGSGPYRHSGWLTADAFKTEADIYLNVKRKFPFQKGTWDIVYSEHMLEHIYVDDVSRVLKEIYRVLKPGGLFRVTVPDLEIHAKNYVEKNKEFFDPIIEKYKSRWDKQKNKYWLVRSPGGAFMTRAVQRFYRHRWMYDFETLSSCLKEVGFSECHKMSFGNSCKDEAGKMDKKERAFETLYIDAIK